MERDKSGSYNCGHNQVSSAEMLHLKMQQKLHRIAEAKMQRERCFNALFAKLDTEKRQLQEKYQKSNHRTLKKLNVIKEKVEMMNIANRKYKSFFSSTKYLEMKALAIRMQKHDDNEKTKVWKLKIRQARQELERIKTTPLVQNKIKLLDMGRKAKERNDSLKLRLATAKENLKLLEIERQLAINDKIVKLLLLIDDVRKTRMKLRHQEKISTPPVKPAETRKKPEIDIDEMLANLKRQIHRPVSTSTASAMRNPLQQRWRSLDSVNTSTPKWMKPTDDGAKVTRSAPKPKTRRVHFDETPVRIEYDYESSDAVDTNGGTPKTKMVDAGKAKSPATQKDMESIALIADEAMDTEEDANKENERDEAATEDDGISNNQSNIESPATVPNTPTPPKGRDVVKRRNTTPGKVLKTNMTPPPTPRRTRRSAPVLTAEAQRSTRGSATPRATVKSELISPKNSKKQKSPPVPSSNEGETNRNSSSSEDRSSPDSSSKTSSHNDTNSHDRKSSNAAMEVDISQEAVETADPRELFNASDDIGLDQPKGKII